jgi:translation elongation factor EF-1beta
MRSCCQQLPVAVGLKHLSLQLLRLALQEQMNARKTQGSTTRSYCQQLPIAVGLEHLSLQLLKLALQEVVQNQQLTVGAQSQPPLHS